jgi:hypothetical protein
MVGVLAAGCGAPIDDSSAGPPAENTGVIAETAEALQIAPKFKHSGQAVGDLMGQSLAFSWPFGIASMVGYKGQFSALPGAGDLHDYSGGAGGGGLFTSPTGAGANYGCAVAVQSVGGNNKVVALIDGCGSGGGTQKVFSYYLQGAASTPITPVTVSGTGYVKDVALAPGNPYMAVLHDSGRKLTLFSLTQDGLTGEWMWAPQPTIALSVAATTLSLGPAGGVVEAFVGMPPCPNCLGGKVEGYMFASTTIKHTIAAPSGVQGFARDVAFDGATLVVGANSRVLTYPYSSGAMTGT